MQDEKSFRKANIKVDGELESNLSAKTVLSVIMNIEKEERAFYLEGTDKIIAYVHPLNIEDIERESGLPIYEAIIKYVEKQSPIGDFNDGWNTLCAIRPNPEKYMDNYLMDEYCS